MNKRNPRYFWTHVAGAVFGLLLGAGLVWVVHLLNADRVIAITVPLFVFAVVYEVRRHLLVGVRWAALDVFTDLTVLTLALCVALWLPRGGPEVWLLDSGTAHMFLALAVVFATRLWVIVGSKQKVGEPEYKRLF